MQLSLILLNAPKFSFFRGFLALIVLLALSVTHSQQPVLADGNKCLTNTGSRS
jgi:hypothetical protein